MDNENKLYYQTIYIFGEEENLEKLKKFISNINNKEYVRCHERDKEDIVTFYSTKDKIKYNISVSNFIISICSIIPEDGFYDIYNELTEELYNKLLIKFFDIVLKKYIIYELKASVTCEITDPNFNLLYLDPENRTTFR